MADQKPDALQFIEKWSRSGGAELANSQLFLIELCKLLDVPTPEPTQPDETLNRYTFEKAVLFNNGDGTYSPGRIDLYRQNCFVLESKQGIERKDIEQAQQLATATREKRYRTGTATRGTTPWAVAMQRARQQAKDYAEALSEWPPFLIVADIGYCFDIYADFSQSGKNYSPFPDPKGYRIYVADLKDERQRGKLRAIWLDPHSLDPSKHAADVTREIATRLAKLAKSLEGQHDPEIVAGFLMRCLFTMFAEDVELIRKDSFSELLLSLRFDIKNFQPMVESLWESMDRGTFSTILREKVKQFNGKFFKDKTALSLTHDQLELLIEAARSNWQYVEPSIFGTLLERALDPVERYKLGAHYTPRAYVERLVMPTIIEPLRQQWDATYAAAVQLDESGDSREAVKLLRDFHGKLCETRVLDPACGSGNFLYVSMELMKRLEGEVVSAIASFGDTVLPGITIDPHQFLGIEINPRAAALAELVLWIGFIQWHKRTRTETTPPEPILRDYGNIECRDAVLEWDSIEPAVDTDGRPITRWDGRTTKPHPVTGEEVPDETARVPELRYINPRKAKWPVADYIVGNPPFIGNKKMALALGDGYTKCLRAVHDDVPASTDLVLYWWNNAARVIGEANALRAGLITTNSITQSFNRQVVASWLKNDVSIVLAIADHPWVESKDGAAVRVAFTVFEKGNKEGRLLVITSETYGNDGSSSIAFSETNSKIYPDLTTGLNTTDVRPLKANIGIVNQGVIPIGAGFRLFEVDLEDMGLDPYSLYPIVRPYVIGMDIVQQPKKKWIIDLVGLSESDVRQKYPKLYQRLYDRVRPARLLNKEKSRRECWWLFARNNEELRKAIGNCHRYIGVPDTSKFKPFVFLDGRVLPDAQVYCIASSGAVHLGVLSSRVHQAWWVKVGPTLEDRPRWKPSVCFETFPFPEANTSESDRVARIAEQLDAHRKRQQELYPKITLTGMYNVLEKLRSGEPLNAKEKTIHEQGLVSVLKQIHDDLDAAVFDAYGWPHDLSDEEILQRLVELNHERAEEEKRGLIRWLRPEFQNPQGQKQEQIDLPEAEDEEATPKATRGKANAIPKAEKRDWPKTLPERVGKVREVLVGIGGPATVETVAAHFTRAPKAAVGELLETLVAVGQARQVDEKRFAI
jgi:hypothetical protein